MFSGHKLSWFTLILFFCLYLFFPSGLSTTDGWYYAASVKHCGEIFYPHHLLYNALGIVFCWLPSKAGFEVISCMKIMNAIFAFLALFEIQQILFYLKLNEKQVILITCLSGISFSVLRFATENETYIVPLFFALLSSFQYLKYLTSANSRYALYAGLCAAVAVLFHQTYIFWWSGLLAGFIMEKRLWSTLKYILISLVVPLVYLVVIMTLTTGSGWDNILNFILGNFKENASLGLTWKGLFFAVLNFIRSFIQVHGYIIKMIRGNFLLLIPGILSIFLVTVAFLRMPKIRNHHLLTHFSKTHILIIILQFIFALFSAGNAEFMVMIPVLIFILVPFFLYDYEKFLLRIFIAMAVWNVSYGLLPLHFKSNAQEKFLCEMALSKRNVIIIASDDQLIKSMLYYQTGISNTGCVYKSPAVLEITGKDPLIFKEKIDSVLNAGTEIYTNCLDETVISRSSIIEGTRNHNFFSNYRTVLIKTWKPVTGIRSVYKVESKL